MKMKVIGWFIAALAVMVALPFLAVKFIDSDAGMMVSILMLFLVNPICYMATGIWAGYRVRTLWGLPLILDILFVIGFWIILSMNSQALVYMGIYTVIAYIAMAVTAMMKSRVQKTCNL